MGKAFVAVFGFLALLLLGCAGIGGGQQAPVAAKGDTVTVDYVGTLDNGTVFDASIESGREPISFVVGAGQMIKGFDAAVVGMKVGDTKNVRIAPEDAYGQWSADMVASVPRANVHGNVTVGSVLQSSDGLTGIVTEITDTTVKLDFNSPLAGKALNFRISMRNITKAG
ncbi:MAG: peptidylprolyl isomerase [Candidatus Micrarchaeia archaeon]